ncbi:ACP S-malonyltransferase [Rahnella bruchi]|uniref:ACP S-malonyltransferase n=1 Tax=Rahnella bruchi TaxID=1510573 RepID=UPI000EA131FF|nr:ACP S-malonyltransferase [Rahnella bruchi]
MSLLSTSKPVVLLFAGQGTSTVGMGADLWDINHTTRSIWDCASDITGKDLRRLCLKGPMNRLVQTSVQQIAVSVINTTLYTLWCEAATGVDIVGSCGHSVGEYSALYAAGILSLEDMFRAVHYRAELMDELSKCYKGSMLAVKSLDYASLSALIADSDLPLEISCDNSNQQQVIGGVPQLLNEFVPLLLQQGCSSIKLGVSGAWHTALMSEGVEPMAQFLRGLQFNQPRHQVLMNVTAQPASDADTIRRNLSLHLTHTVKWTDSMTHFLQAETPCQFVEISNKAYLTHLLHDYPMYKPDNGVHCRQLLSRMA